MEDERLKVRLMGQSDIGFAFRLTTEEQWGYTEVEFDRILALDPDGSFVLEDAGEPQGFVTTSSYSRTGVVGHLIVRKDSRGKAWGRALMKAALARLDSAGVESVLLNAVPAATRFYERFGFRVSRDTVVMKVSVREEVKRSASVECPRLTEADLAEMIALDGALLGDQRKKILRRLLGDSLNHAFKIERDGQMLGFVLGRETSSCSDVGPWLCVSGRTEDAQMLLDAVISTLPSGDVYFAGFSENRDMVAMTHALGPARSSDTKLMVRGKDRYPSAVNKVFAIAATEFG